MKKIWIILFILLPPAAVFIGLFAGRYELGLTEVTGALMEFVRSGVMSIAGGEAPQACPRIPASVRNATLW